MSEPEATDMEPQDAGSEQMPEEIETSKDVNQNIETLSYEEKVQFIDNEVQSLLQFCISKGLTDKELNLCVKSFTGETSSAAQRFYKTNSRFFFIIAFLTVIGAVAIGFEPVNTQLNVHARLAFLKMNYLIEEYYMEPDKITISTMQSEADKRRVHEDLNEYGPEKNSEDSDQVESVNLKTHYDPMAKDNNAMDKIVFIND